MLLLVFLHPLQDAPHIELHATDEGNLQDESAHEVIEHFVALPLQLHRLVVLQIP